MADSKSPKDPGNLPDNLNDCHNLIQELFARIAQLEKQLSRRNRATFGRKSAKVDAALLTGTGKTIHNETVDELHTRIGFGREGAFAVAGLAHFIWPPWRISFGRLSTDRAAKGGWHLWCITVPYPVIARDGAREGARAYRSVHTAAPLKTGIG